MKVKNKNNKKLVFSILSFALLLAAGVFAFYHFTNPDSNGFGPKTDLNSATDEQKKDGDKTKSDTINNTDGKPSQGGNANETPADPSIITVQTTASAQNGSTYQLRYLLESVLSSGECSLILTNGSQTVTKTSKIQALAQSSTCQGFDIPTSELSPGAWEVTMSVSGDGKTGSTSSTIRVQ